MKKYETGNYNDKQNAEWNEKNECSNCEAYAPINFKFKYCPYCGSFMKNWKNKE